MLENGEEGREAATKLMSAPIESFIVSWSVVVVFLKVSHKWEIVELKLSKWKRGRWSLIKKEWDLVVYSWMATNKHGLSE